MQSSPLPKSAPHLYLSSNKSTWTRCNLSGPRYKQTSLSVYHLALDSPTHSATRRLRLSIPFFLSFLLTYTWRNESDQQCPGAEVAAQKLWQAARIQIPRKRLNWANQNQTSQLTAGYEESTSRAEGWKGDRWEKTNNSKRRISSPDFPCFHSN